MAEKAWVLTDVARGIWHETFERKGAELGLSSEAARCSIQKRVLRSGLQEGVDWLELDNGALKLAIVPTRGMGIHQGSYRGIFLGWKSPVRGPVHPKFVRLEERNGLGWLTGFDEWIVRCGLDSNGAPGPDVVLDNNGNPTTIQLNLHGRIANIPAHFVQVRVAESPPYTLEVVGEVEETMMFGPHLRMRSTIRTVPNASWFVIEDEVWNMRAVEGELELLYHCNFGQPFLEEGAQLVVPIKEMAPRDRRATEGVDHFNTYAAPTPGYIEQVYWYELLGDPQTKQTLAMLRNARGDLAAVLRWNLRELPYFTQWKNTAAEADGYVTGLEPGTNLPNTRRFERERNRVVKLGPGELYRASLRVEILDSAVAVTRAEQEIQRLQGLRAPTVHRQPVPQYSPV
jgi:hypothetical protein